MRILFVSPRQGWPPLSGAKLREYHLCRALGQSAEIDYVFFAQAGQPEPQPADLPFCRRIVPVPAPPMYRPLQLIRGLIGRWPLPIVNYTAPAMSEALHKLAAEGRPYDLIHLDSIHMAGYVDMLRRLQPRARFVYNWHNIESEAMLSHSGTLRGARQVYARLTASRLARAEAWALRDAHGHLVCSDRERQILLEQAPGTRIAVIDNGVECAYFAAPGAPPAEPRRIVFVGTMSYHPNIEAVLSFAARIWPAIHERHPDWHLSLVGANPPPEVRDLSRIRGVEVTGTVPDVRPYYHDALAAIVPLRSGGGTRLKILEAMAAGVPVLSTALGAEGLDVEPGRDYLLVEQDPEWLPALEALAADPARRQQIRQTALDRVRGRYDWEVIGAALRQTYQEWS